MGMGFVSLYRDASIKRLELTSLAIVAKMDVTFEATSGSTALVVLTHAKAAFKTIHEFNSISV
jgi:hypothetical protein